MTISTLLPKSWFANCRKRFRKPSILYWYTAKKYALQRRFFFVFCFRSTVHTIEKQHSYLSTLYMQFFTKNVTYYRNHVDVFMKVSLIDERKTIIMEKEIKIPNVRSWIMSFCLLSSNKKPYLAWKDDDKKKNITLFRQKMFFSKKKSQTW